MTALLEQFRQWWRGARPAAAPRRPEADRRKPVTESLPVRARPEPASPFQQGIVARGGLRQEDMAPIRVFENEYLNTHVELSLPPSSALDLMPLIDDPHFPMTRLAAAIGGDPAVAGAVMKTANSAAFRGRAEIANLRQAIPRLGMRQLKLLALTVLLKSTLVKGEPYQTLAMLTWKHSLLCARLAERMARIVNADPDHAYMAGLFHDVGVLAVLSALRNFTREQKLALSSGAIVDVIARHGYYLNPRVVKTWNLPPLVSGAVVRFRTFGSAGDAATLAAIVALVNDMGKPQGLWVERQPVDWGAHKAVQFLRLTLDDLPAEAEIARLAREIEAGC